MQKLNEMEIDNVSGGVIGVGVVTFPAAVVIVRTQGTGGSSQEGETQSSASE